MTTDDDCTDVLMLLGTYLAGSIASWLTERKNGLLIPKRHQSKHLEVVLRWFRTKVSAEGICESRRTRHFDSSAPVALVVRHPQRRDLLGLENRTQAAWRVILPDQKELTVPPGGCVGLNPQVLIAFGSNMAEIV